MVLNNDDEQGTHLGETSSSEPATESRRDALKKLGKYGAYTAPAMLALLTSQKTLGGGMTGT